MTEKQIHPRDVGKAGISPAADARPADPKQECGRKPCGRPRKWRSPRGMWKAIQQYFKQPGPKSMFELALVLGFDDDSGLWAYEHHYGPGFSTIISRARTMMREYYDKAGQEHKSGNFHDKMLARMKRPAYDGPDALPGAGGVVVVVFGGDKLLPVKPTQAIVSDAPPALNPPEVPPAPKVN